MTFRRIINDKKNIHDILLSKRKQFAKTEKKYPNVKI